ncbi:sigma-70 family RNA polymerase sigma factor [Anaerococcus sp. AGMB00486]|uniref:Sigma-70 family RNA polymerase sigma factor n=2 Tax=Anaerococcus TaxID=165779 RepID=A0ABX2N8S0_9FIRM|nr:MULTISPECIES: sigma-70 family RNA polymerase sigma factor [Anaerococcus]MDY3006585.1 sigma-70 family RNA polymerase sigma factor [Anaerococcus porci]MSS77431.1 sigma-70 family RNA polymerase sigma factor [Anaerococcus porci]NVF11090.1 sigma-70 family RNA polymerase sigma factor [Anaerococcus faecalis]
MKICIENLDAIIRKYKPLIISTINKFPIYDRNEAYIKAYDFILNIVEDYDEKRGKFGGYIKYRLYYYFLDMSKKKEAISLNDKDKKGIELIENLKDNIDIEKDLIKNVEIKVLNDAIKKLNKRQRDIIYLKYNKNFSHKKIGSLLNISPKTVTNIHGDIIYKLRRILREEEILENF